MVARLKKTEKKASFVLKIVAVYSFQRLLSSFISLSRRTVSKPIYKGENLTDFVTFLSVKYSFNYLPPPLEAVYHNGYVQELVKRSLKILAVSLPTQ